MSLSRRAVLVGALAALGTSACSRRPGGSPTSDRSSYASDADEVRGSFSWRRAQGTTINVLLPRHPSSAAIVAGLASFESLTGVRVRTRTVGRERYFDEVTRQLVSGEASPDAFLTGPATVWQYAPPGWMEDLTPWMGNPAATFPLYDLDDVMPGMLATTRWDLVSGEAVGHGAQWALPLTWEPVGLAYRADVLDRLGLTAPGSLAELEDAAVACTRYLATRVTGGYGLALPGIRSWTTVQGAFVSQYLREGGLDFDTSGGQVLPAVATDASVAFHTRWTRMVRDAGPTRWTSQTGLACWSDLRGGRAAMSYETPAGVLPRTSAVREGTLAWSPGPAGPSGDLTSDLWVWSMAVSSRSRHKLAAWLFLQWATGADHARFATRSGCLEPVRESALVDRPVTDVAGYDETVEAVRAASRVAFTPQPYFFDAATGWVEAMHEMYAGRDPRNALQELSARFRRRG